MVLNMSRYHRIADALSTIRWFHGTSSPEFSRFRPGDPGFAGDDIRVRVSLHLEEDLKIVPARVAAAAVPARTSKGLDVLVEAEESSRMGVASGTVTVTDPATGRQVGSLDFSHISDEWHRVTEVEVEEGYKRRGVATLMYDWVEKTMGKALLPSDDQTDDAVAFWTNRWGPYDLLGDEGDEDEGDEDEWGEDVTAHIAGFHDQEHEDYYMSEACAYFAIALHELYGYPLRILVDEGIEEEEEEEEEEEGMPTVAHVYAVDRKGDAVDIKGHRSEEEVKREFWDLVEPATYDVTPEELKRDWMGDDDDKPLYAPSESEVADAKAIILAEPAHDTSWPSPKLSRQAWSRDTLNLGTTCSECGSDLDVAGRAGDPDDPLCTACWGRSQMPEDPPDPPSSRPKGKWWWWNASVR